MKANQFKIYFVPKVQEVQDHVYVYAGESVRAELKRAVTASKVADTCAFTNATFQRYAVKSDVLNNVASRALMRLLAHVDLIEKGKAKIPTNYFCYLRLSNSMKSYAKDVLQTIKRFVETDEATARAAQTGADVTQ